METEIKLLITAEHAPIALEIQETNLSYLQVHPHHSL